MCESNRRTDTLTPQGRACIPSRDKMSCIRYRQCSLSRMLWNKRTYRLIVLGTCACRAMLCKRGLCRHAMSVCLSVCPSVCVSADTLANSVKTNTHIFKCFFHHWEPSNSSFSVPNSMVILRRGIECELGRQKLRF